MMQSTRATTLYPMDMSAPIALAHQAESRSGSWEKKSCGQGK